MAATTWLKQLTRVRQEPMWLGLQLPAVFDPGSSQPAPAAQPVTSQTGSGEYRPRSCRVAHAPT